MNTLHLLPGESPGDTADLVLSPAAVRKLIDLLHLVLLDEHACAIFGQRDGKLYTLCVEVIDRDHDHPAWRHIRLAYMRHQARHVLRDYRNRNYDADLLSAHLYAARKVRRHNQSDAARTMGVSLGFVSNVENCKYVPRPESFEKLFAYMGTSLGDYEIKMD